MTLTDNEGGRIQLWLKPSKQLDTHFHIYPSKCILKVHVNVLTPLFPVSIYYLFSEEQFDQWIGEFIKLILWELIMQPKLWKKCKNLSGENGEVGELGEDCFISILYIINYSFNHSKTISSVYKIL